MTYFPGLEIQVMSLFTPRPPPQFIVDRPFTYAIVKSHSNNEATNNNINLFVGQIFEPTV